MHFFGDAASVAAGAPRPLKFDIPFSRVCRSASKERAGRWRAWPDDFPNPIVGQPSCRRPIGAPRAALLRAAAAPLARKKPSLDRRDSIPDLPADWDVGRPSALLSPAPQGGRRPLELDRQLLFRHQAEDALRGDFGPPSAMVAVGGLERLFGGSYRGARPARSEMIAVHCMPVYANVGRTTNKSTWVFLGASRICPIASSRAREACKIICILRVIGTRISLIYMKSWQKIIAKNFAPCRRSVILVSSENFSGRAGLSSINSSPALRSALSRMTAHFRALSMSRAWLQMACAKLG